MSLCCKLVLFKFRSRHYFFFNSLSGWHLFNSNSSSTGVTLEPRLKGMLGTHSKKDWHSVAASGPHEEGGVGAGITIIDKDGLDLLDQMLCYDHQERISARDALKHRFFDPMRGSASNIELSTRPSPR
ncbi:unnamed protein product [Choristocarpus tenellus]